MKVQCHTECPIEPKALGEAAHVRDGSGPG